MTANVSSQSEAHFVDSEELNYQKETSHVCGFEVFPLEEVGRGPNNYELQVGGSLRC